MSWAKEFRDFFDGFFDSPANYAGGFGLLAPTESGIDVNETSSLTVGAVAACQRIISSAVASMGCYVYERMPDGGHRLATEHPLFPILSLSPTPEYPAVDFFSTGQVNLLQNGNGYAEILRNEGGQVAELLLRSPFRTQTYRDNVTGSIYYKTTDTPTGKERTVAAKDMIHVKNMGVVPYIGLSPIRMYMREVIGVAMAAQAYGARIFKNDTRPGGYLKSAATVNKDKKLEQIQSWVAGHRGANNHMPAYLDGGVEWANVGIAPDEAQFLQTRQFQRSEIASIYGVPAHMLGDPQETKATIEQKALEFLLWTVKIWLRRWEHAFNVKLFPTVGRNAGKFFAKFDTSEFERADYATMLKGIQTGRYAGLYSIDEGRKLLGLNPTTSTYFDGSVPGSTLFRPVNMAIMSDDPTMNAVQGTPGSQPQDPDDDTSGGSGSGKGNNDGAAPAEDQPDPADDGADDSRALALCLPLFEGALTHIEALNKPTSKAIQERLTPVFQALAGDEFQAVYPNMLEIVKRIRANGVTEAERTTAPVTLMSFQALVRAVKSHGKETQ